MVTIKVVPRYFLEHPETGERANAHGAVPPGYELRCSGFTWEITWSDGSVTFGLGRAPVKTKAAALRIAKRVAARTGAAVERS